MFISVLCFYLAILFVIGCDNSKKDSTIELSVSDLFFVGTIVRTYTYIRINNGRSVQISGAIYDNSICDPNAVPKYSGQPCRL